MKIKSYRAPSLREALIQIKEELGEDALVIETKPVRAGGFLGVGVRNLIEVRVAPSPQQATEKRPAAPKTQKGAKLSLTEDSTAAPTLDKDADPAPLPAPTKKAKAEERPFGAFAALAARAAAADNRQRKTSAKPDRAPGGLRWPKGQGVELADTAPRVVHRRPLPKPAPPTTAPPAKPPEPTEPTTKNWSEQHQSVNNELARMRAEMREMKFALGAFAARPAQNTEWKASRAFDANPALCEMPFYEVYLELTAAGLEPNLAQQVLEHTTPASPRKAEADVYTLGRAALTNLLPSWIKFADSALGVHAIAAFIGPTGVGKTTTIAKLAAHIALRARQRVELITLDTYRIAAVQQLKTYAEIIGAGCHIAHSVVELDALTRRFAGKAAVLIDTTGRSPRDLADQMELADYLCGNQALYKCLVLPATTQTGDAQHALSKFTLYGADRLVLTKLDETVQPGTAVKVAALAGLPLTYLCAGQRVPEDMERATPAALAARVLRPRLLTNAA